MARYTKLLMVALILGLSWGVLFSQHLVYADDPDRVIPTIGVGSLTAGTIDVLWSTPTDAPRDYRLTWGKQNAQGEYDYASWSAENSSTAGNAYPSASATSYTITGLDAGTYKAKIRARYDDNLSGEWNASSSVVVSGSGDPSTPVPTAVVETPTPEIAYSHDGTDADHVVPIPPTQSDSRMLASNINKPVGTRHVLNRYDIVKYAFTVPNTQYGIDIFSIKLRVRDWDSGDSLEAYVLPKTDAGDIDPKYRILRFNAPTVSTQDVATLTTNGRTVINHTEAAREYYLELRAASGSFSIGQTNASDYDSGTMAGWSLNRLQVMVIGRERPISSIAGVVVPTVTPEPSCYDSPRPSSCTRPSSTIRADGTLTVGGGYRSSSLTSSTSKRLFKVRLEPLSEYRISVQNANNSDKTLPFPKVRVLAQNTEWRIVPPVLETGLKTQILVYGGSGGKAHETLPKSRKSHVERLDIRTPCIYNGSTCKEIRKDHAYYWYEWEFPDFYYIEVSSEYTGTFAVKVESVTGLSSQIGDGSVPGSGRYKSIDFQDGASITNERFDVPGDRDWYRVNAHNIEECTVTASGYGEVGSVRGVDVTNRGTGYTSGTHTGVIISGGTGATISVRVYDDGTIRHFTVTSGGSGYSPSSTVTLPAAAGSGAGAAFRVVTTGPAGGLTMRAVELSDTRAIRAIKRGAGSTLTLTDDEFDDDTIVEVRSTSNDVGEYQLSVADCEQVTSGPGGPSGQGHTPINLTASRTISTPRQGGSASVTGTVGDVVSAQNGVVLSGECPAGATDCGRRAATYWHKVNLTGYHHDDTRVVNAGRKYKVTVSGALSNAAILIVPSVIKLEATGTGSSRSPVTDADGNYTVLESCQNPETFAQLSNSLSTGDSKVIEEFAPYYRTSSGSALHKFRVVYYTDSVRRENNWNVPQNCFFINVYSISESAGSYTLTVRDIGSQ